MLFYRYAPFKLPKNFPTFLLFCLGLLLAYSVQSQTSPEDFQPLWKSWEHIFPDIKSFRAKDAILLRDGKTLVVVGIHTKEDGLSFGAIYALDRETGSLLSPTSKYPLVPHSAFNGVAQANDGSIYLVGSMPKGNKQTQGLVIRLNGTNFQEEWRSTTEDVSLDRIVWLKCGTGLATVNNPALRPNSLQVYRIMGQKIEKCLPIDSDLENLAAMLPVPHTDSLVWLVGTTRKGMDAWILRVNDQGNYSERPRSLEAGFDETITTAAVSLSDGRLLLGGKAQHSTELYDKLLILLSKEAKGIEPPFSPASNPSEYISAITATAGHDFLYLHTFDERKKYAYLLEYTKGGLSGRFIDTLKGLNDFTPIAFLRDSIKNQYFIVGSERAVRGTDLRLCIVAITEAYDQGPKKQKELIATGIAISEPNQSVLPRIDSISFSKATVHLLVVGIDLYDQEPMFNYLSFPVQGANDIKSIYERQGLAQGITVALTGPSAKRADILRELKNLANSSKVHENDLIIFFYSGHGLMEGGKIGICPWNYEDAADMIEETTITSILDSSRAQHKVCFIEACRNENTLDVLRPEDLLRFQESRRNLAPGMVFLTSTQVGQKSLGNNNIGGFFTRAIREGLGDLTPNTNPDSNNDRNISAEELFNYVQARVKELSKGKQIPQINDKYPKELILMRLSN